MIITDYFNFIHIPKTGGTFVRELLCSSLFQKDFNTMEIGENHYSGIYTDSDKPQIAFIRDPYTWYLSFYHFWKKGGFPKPKTSIYDIASRNNNLDFVHTINNLLSADFQCMNRDKDVYLYNDIPQKIFNKLIEQSMGFYTYTIRQAIYDFKNNCINKNVILGHTEFLKMDLLNIFKKLNIPLTEKQIEAIINKDISNKTDYEFIYDSELNNLIKSKDEHFISTLSKYKHYSIINNKFNDIYDAELAGGAIINDNCPGFKEDYLIIHCLIKKYKPKNIFEIGTHEGLGTKILKNAIGDGEVISLDLPPEQAHLTSQRPPDALIGHLCDMPYTQVFGNSMEYNYEQHYPIDAWYIDGEHEYKNVLHESKEAIKSNAKLIIWHDTDIHGIYIAIMEAFENTENYELYRITDTRITFAVKK